MQVLRVTTTGLVIDSGNGVSHTMTIYEGFARHAILHSAGHVLIRVDEKTSPSKGTLSSPQRGTDLRYIFMALNVSSVRTVQAGWSLLAPRRSTISGMIPGCGGRTQCLSTKLALCITPSFWLAVFFWVLESRHGTRVLYHYCHREEFVREIKEKLCYIGLDYYNKHKSLAQVDKEETYALPDGDIIAVAPNVSVARKCCSSHTVPIYDGSALHHAILRSAGRGLTVSSTRSSPSKGTHHRRHKEEKTGELPNGNINVAPNFPVV